ncbi:replicative DNA helicase [Paenibacillus periandrae]|uniref:replicative DNA helicase n=1 Tax=Paenibacillus periandrae TaxID=1761741 RepID=UPI001F0941B2|nr:replicative DNA helicase [Paenibacillus periandrae]
MDQEPEIKPPQNIEAEQTVLGAIFLSNEALDDIEWLKGEAFFDKQHARIYRAMKSLRSEGAPIEISSMLTKLKDGGELEKVGGVMYLNALLDAATTAANIDYYARLVLGEYHKRVAIMETEELHEQAKQGGDTSKIIANLQAVQTKLEDHSVKGADFKMIKDVCLDFYENLEVVASSPNKSGVTGVSSGFPDLDRVTAGFQKQDSIIVAARPSVGKTAFALNIAQNVGIIQKKVVPIFSLEMGARLLVQRMACAEANVDANKMRTGMLDPADWEKVAMAVSIIAASDIYIDDTPSITISEIRAKCRRLKKEKGEIGMILIDYLQLIAGSGGHKNREQEVSEISRTIKQIAREMDCPVITLSQLSRGVEQRQEKRPMMSDLRESGSIEQDADIVAFLYRDDYYDKESEKKNIIEIIIAKQRNGSLCTVELAFLKSFNKFATLDHVHQETAGTQQAPPPKKAYDNRRRFGA